MSNCEPIAGLRETQAMPSISFGGNCLYFQGKWLYSYVLVSPGAWGDVSHLTVVSQRKFYHRYWISAVSCFFMNTGLRGKAGLLSQRHYQRTWHVWWFSWEPSWDWNLISPLKINYLGIKVSIISFSLHLRGIVCVWYAYLFAHRCVQVHLLASMRIPSVDFECLFSIHLHLLFWQNHSLNIELTDSARLSSKLLGLSCLNTPGLQQCILSPGCVLEIHA